MSILFKNFGPYSKLRTANWPIAWRKQTQPYNNTTYINLFIQLAVLLGETCIFLWLLLHVYRQVTSFFISNLNLFN